jgi:hypothetical protein
MPLCHTLTITFKNTFPIVNATNDTKITHNDPLKIPPLSVHCLHCCPIQRIQAKAAPNLQTRTFTKTWHISTPRVDDPTHTNGHRNIKEYE